MFTAAGKSAAVSAANYIEDVFSTYLYTGNSSTQTITNGIDLSGKGGLVWIKSRTQGTTNYTANHYLYDTLRGVNNRLASNSTSAQLTEINALTAFNSNGFSLGSLNNSNYSGDFFVSWTFRKQAKFFDVVTFTTPASGTITVPHNLGSTPGCVITKATGITQLWIVNHRSLLSTQYLELNSTAAAANASPLTYTADANNVTFSAGYLTANTAYVMYLFAHDAGGFGAAGTDNVISCGSFTTDGSGNATVSLGYEPQWLLQKSASGSFGTGNWFIADNMRGLPVGSAATLLRPNLTDAESTGGTQSLTATGFSVSGFQATTTYIYIAIRRGPMKTPTSGTSVYEPVTYTGNNANNRTVGTLTSPDLGFDFYQVTNTDTFAGVFFDRLRGPSNLLYAARTDSEVANTVTNNFPMNGASISFSSSTQTNSSSYNYGLSLFRRAPGFFDVVCYSGDSTLGRAIQHNLAAIPELMIVKNRNNTENWVAYSSTLGNTKYLILNSTAASGTRAIWANTTPTSTNFYVGGSGVLGETNFSSYTYIAYLFATVTGVSKVGSYNGTGLLQTVPCGFTSGARFVLIKRTDIAGDWWVYDSARGITSGNDPYYLVNTGQNITGTNYVDTDSTGFQVTAAAPAGLNAVGGNYIFLAIA